MKKLIAIIAAAAMILSLAACGSSKTEETASESAAAAESTEAAAETEAATETVDKVDTNTVAVGAIVIARDDVSEEAVYNFVSTIYENAEAVTEQHAKGAELDLEFASSVTAVPYHPGAAKYFEEKGFEVAAVKEGAGEGDGTALTFSTGSETGTYFAYGGVLGQYVTSNTDLDITVVSSNGSQANIEDLVAGNVQLGFTQSDTMAYAYNGERLFEAPLEGFSVVCALYMEQMQIVTTDPSIATVADLAGKKVSIGASGSGTYFSAIDALGVYGITEEDIEPIYQGFTDSAESLKDGKIDAAFIVAGAPTTAITDLATAKDVYLVGFDEDHIASLIEACPFYSAYTIPAGTY